MRGSLGLAHAPGIVAVLDGFPSPDPQSFVGRPLQIRTPDGRDLAAEVGAVRDHGATISFFLPGLARSDCPAGSRLVIGPAPG